MSQCCGLQGQLYGLSCLEYKEAEGGTKPRPEEMPRVRARGARGKTQIQMLLVSGRGSCKSEAWWNQSRKEASLKQIKEDPGRLFKRMLE